MAMSTELRSRIRAVAEELRQELFGPRGVPAWGTKFVALEDQACEVGDALTQAILATAVEQQQAAIPRGPVECGCCGRVAAEDGLQPQAVTTRRGEIAWRERKYYCRHCRRAFFPSLASVGPGSG